MSNSNDLMNGLVELGMAALVGYGACKGVEYLAESQRRARQEEEQRRLSAPQRLAWAQQAEGDRQRNEIQRYVSKMDAVVDQLIANPGSALEVIRDCVSEMEEANWKLFSGLLAEESERHPVARGILGLAYDTRLAVGEVSQLVSHSVDEAASLVPDIWSQKDEAEQAGFIPALHAKAKSSVRARALLGRLTA